MKFKALFTSMLLISFCAFGETALTPEQIYSEAYDNFVKRDYTAASASLDKINAVDQKKTDVLNLRGAIYRRLGELDNAANAYNDALKINPKDWVPKYNLAEVNFLREQYKSSRTYLEQALTSMPEADRLEKQDLVLYKVYLTYLMQGDDDKAKLLLESFDMNSPNPIYYYAQAAWSYKHKDEAKAKTWVDSTDGLYSQELRNSYSQSLVDIGWLEPVEGAPASKVANATASPTPESSPESSPAATPSEAVASATVTPALATDIVPLATNDATSISVASGSMTPTEMLQATVANTATPEAVTKTPDAQRTDGKIPFWVIFLAVLVVLGLGAIFLMNLAKKSRIVPAPVDNTGYDAIAASADGNSAHSSEGTGAVVEQEIFGASSPVAAPIKVTPIHREYAADQKDEQEKAAPRITRKINGPTRTINDPAPELREIAPVPVPETEEVSDVEEVPAPAKLPVKIKKIPTKTAAKPSTAAKPKPTKTSAPASAKKIVGAASSTKVRAKTASTATSVSEIPPTPTKITVESKKAPTTKIALDGGSPVRTRLIPVSSVTVPLTEEVRKSRVLAAKVPTIVVPQGADDATIVKTIEAAEKTGFAAPAKADAKVSKKKPTAKKVAPAAAETPTAPVAKTLAQPGPKITRPVRPIISIPEFENPESEPQNRTVLRVLPNQPDNS